MLGEGLAVPTGLVTVALLTRALGTADYGRYTLAVGFVLLLQAGISSLLGRATVKFVGELPDSEAVATTVLRLHVAIGGALAVTVALTAPFLAQLLGEPDLVDFLRVFAVSLPIEAASDAHANILVGRGQYRRRAVVRATYWCARPLLILAPVFAGYGVDGALIGAVLAPLIALLVARRRVRPRLFGMGGSAVGPLLMFGLPLFVSGAATIMAQRLDLFALKAFGGSAADAGLYAAAQTLAWMPALLAYSFSPLLLASVTSALTADRPERAQLLATDFYRAALLLMPIGAATIGAAGQITRFAYGEAFEPAGPFLAWLIVSGISVPLATTSAAVLVATRRLRPLMVASLLPLIVSVAAFGLLIPRYGAIGAAASTVLGTTTGVLFGLLVVRWQWGVSPPVATVLRALVVAPLAWYAAVRGPQDGVWLVAKLAGIAIATPLLFAALGEFGTDQMRRMSGVLKSLR